MERVLILTYFFPPCNLSAAQRSWAWAKYLPEHGFQPIVVTRAWDKAVVTRQDLLRPVGSDEVAVEEGEGYQLHYLPYRPNLRDRLFVNSSAPVFRKLLTGTELFLRNYFYWAVPYENIYRYAREFLEKNKDVTKLIVSANPYPLFQFAYLLCRQFPRLKWIADYRGDWNTKQFNMGKGTIWGLIRKLESRSERKWVREAVSLISTSEKLTDRISSFTGKRGHTVPDGWMEEEFEERVLPSRPDTFVITYSGELVAEQKIERFLEAFKEVVDEYEGRIDLKIRFLGLDYYPEAAQRVLDSMGVYLSTLELYPELPREELIRRERRSDLLLMLPCPGQKGAPASKVYRYIGARKSVLCFPGDDDYIDDILEETGLGKICNNILDAYEFICERIEQKLSGINHVPTINETVLEKYSRRTQTQLIAQLLNEL